MKIFLEVLKILANLFALFSIVRLVWYCAYLFGILARDNINKIKENRNEENKKEENR